MSRTLQFRRLGTATLANTTGANGELIINSTNKTLTVHDGTTPGGFALLNQTTEFDIDQYARNTANTATSNITIIQGVNTTQNTNISIIQGVNATQNTNITNATNLAQNAYNYANTIVSDTQIDQYARNEANGAVIASTSALNENIVLRGVNDAQNTRISLIEDVNTTQNTNITNATTLAQAAFDAANTENIGIVWSISASGTSDYVFSGPGIVAGNTNDPVLYLYKGFTYSFVNTTGGSHPFAIRVSNGGDNYTLGVSGSQTGTQTFVVPMNAPSTLYYQCTIHSTMGNVINII
jgi:hypothetical protein